MRIENRKISLDSDPFIIAELSGNHNKSLNEAKKIIGKAADAGVHMLEGTLTGGVKALAENNMICLSGGDAAGARPQHLQHHHPQAAGDGGGAGAGEGEPAAADRPVD